MRQPWGPPLGVEGDERFTVHPAGLPGALSYEPSMHGGSVFKGYSWRGVAILAFGASALSLACHEAGVPTSPVVRTPPPITPPPPQPNAVLQGPAPDGPGTSFAQSTDLYAYSDAYHGGSISSRYILYEDSTLALEFLSNRFGYFTYLGRWRRAGDSLTFAFNGWSAAGPWEATASLHSDSLSVHYNAVMELSDFVGGVYLRR